MGHLLNSFKSSCFFSSKITMETQHGLKLITLLLLLEVARTVAMSSTSPSFSPIVIQAEYGTNYQKIINSTIEYMFLYPASNVNSDETNSFENIPYNY